MANWNEISREIQLVEQPHGPCDVFRRRYLQGLAELTGTQGVIIPRANIQNLMLSREVVDAVRAGLFNIWAVSTVDEGTVGP
jgi:predicted ATP-dependent protease